MANRFDPRKALFALQGRMVITDDASPFEWVGSNGAGSCVIILIHAIDDRGNRVAACGHLSATDSPHSILLMLNLMDAKTILTVHLVSGQSTEEDEISKGLFSILDEIELKQENRHLSLGKVWGNNSAQAALNVQTGEVIYDNFSLKIQNAGENGPDSLLIFSMSVMTTAIISANTNIPNYLILSIDGRKESDVKRIEELLKAVEMEPTESMFFECYELLVSDFSNFVLKTVEMEPTESMFFECYKLLVSAFFNFVFKTLLGPPERKALLGPPERKALLGPPERKALLGPPERKALTYSLWDEAKAEQRESGLSENDQRRVLRDFLSVLVALGLGASERADEGLIEVSSEPLFSLR
jgi:hypothetical protein